MTTNPNESKDVFEVQNHSLNKNSKKIRAGVKVNSRVGNSIEFKKQNNSVSIKRQEGTYLNMSNLASSYRKNLKKLDIFVPENNNQTPRCDFVPTSSNNRNSIKNQEFLNKMGIFERKNQFGSFTSNKSSSPNPPQTINTPDSQVPSSNYNSISNPMDINNIKNTTELQESMQKQLPFKPGKKSASINLTE